MDSISNLDHYYSDLSSVNILSKQEELYHFTRYSEEGCTESKKLLIYSNLKLVFSIAKAYAKDKPNTLLLELISAGNEGLLHALDRYDPTKGTKFSTYCGSWVLMYIRRFAVCENHLIKPSSRARRKAKLDEQLKKRWCNYVPFKESYMSGSQGDIAEEVVEDDSSRYDNKVLISLLNFLKPRERYILCSSFGYLDHPVLSLRSLGKKLNLSSERVRQIKLRALNLLKEWMEFYY